ncbi:MAG: FAD:protein FMN transferase [Prevotellaceae bacterium]|nr:FAD:protein FMN transferase [Prevotellaceae bacterium]
MKIALKILFLLLLIGGTAWILIDTNTAPYRKMEGKIFGTYYHITYQSSTDYDADILAQLQAVDASLSAFNPQSIVSQVNRNEPVRVDAMFEQVFTLAQEVSAATNGAFDITVAPLVNLWGFGFDSRDDRFASKSDELKREIDSIMPFVGHDKVKMLNSKRISKQDERTMLDFSAIAKGYGCDQVAALLIKHGITNFLVEIGGEIVAHGINPDKRAWTVGIEQPTHNDGLTSHPEANNTIVPTAQMTAFLTFPLKANKRELYGLATSGNYRNFYVKDGQRYAHTIDPKTGRPVQHSLLSATVIAPNCATADAYATAFMVMGLKKAKTLIENDNRLQAFLIYADGDQTKTWHSSGLDNYIK